MKDKGIKRAPISISILAGGRGTRMDGQDKGLLGLHGQALALRSYLSVRHESQDILINANRHHQQYTSLLPECRLVADRYHNYMGPLAGIYSSLRVCRHRYLLALPCDLLSIPDNCVENLWQALLGQQRQVAYAVINGQPVYPLCLVDKQLLPSLHRQLKQQRFAVWRWLSANHAVAVNFSMQAPHPFNLNTHACLNVAEQWVESV